jgi:hypothetical protein
VPEAPQLTADVLAQSLRIVWHRIAHPLFDIAMTVLLRVQLRRICWQPFNDDLRMFRQILTYASGAMGAQSIPDDDHRSPDRAPQVLQRLHDVIGGDRPLDIPTVNAPADRQCQQRRDRPALINAAKNGWLAAWRPCRCSQLPEGKAGLVDKDDLSGATRGFFLGTNILETPRQFHRLLGHGSKAEHSST